MRSTTDRSSARSRSGAWTAWPHAGSPDADPYSIAMLARTGEVPLGAGEGIAFTAEIDSDGAPLSGALHLPDRRPDAGGAPVDAHRL